MSRIEALNGRSDLQAHLDRTRDAGSLLEVDAWMPSEVKAISPRVDRLMRLIEESHCIPGKQSAVELALSEALSNAVIHGNRLDARKLVHVRCRCKVGNGISLIVSDQGQGLMRAPFLIPWLSQIWKRSMAAGIHLMKWAMDRVWFEQGGTEVHMCKRLARARR